MFESISGKLQGIFQKLSKRGRLSETNIQEALREVRLALLEADVNYKVVKDFIKRVEERAIGQEVTRSLTPGQQVVRIVNDVLVELMGPAETKIKSSSHPPTVVMLVGLQGSGKTTVCGKLACYFKTSGKYPLMVAADIYRPAAVQQLETLAKKLEVPVYGNEKENSPVVICRQAVQKAVSLQSNLLLIDTAGRLHIDEKMMNELVVMKETLCPDEVLLVADAMTGQDAVNIAREFENSLGIDGVILTKMDGDARGGAALSLRAVTQKPIKFIGVGEKLSDLEPFYPERVASRILGMGDVLSLVEKAEKLVSVQEAKELKRKIRKEAFTLEDFLVQLEQMKKLGSLESIMSMLPGVSNLKGMSIDDKKMTRIEAIVRSMTPKERLHPEIIDGSRRRRVACGSGTTVQEVNAFLKQFNQAKKMMRQMGKFSKLSRMMRF